MKTAKSNYLLTAAIALTAFSASAFADSQVASYARESGYTACIKAVEDIENFFTKDTNYGSWTFVAKDDTKRQLLNAAIELTYQDSSTLVDLTVAPTSDGNCSYTYTRTMYTSANCIAASRDSYMSNAKYKTNLNKNIAAFEDGSSKILLMPAGAGCIVQKKEVGFRHAKQAK